MQLWGCTGNVNQAWISIPYDQRAQEFRVVKNAYSGLCIDDWGNSSANNTNALQWYCSWSDFAETMDFQRNSWTWVESIANSTLWPQQASGLCLDDLYGNPNKGARVDFWSCNGTVSQQWYDGA